MNTSEYQRPPIKVALMGLGRSMFETHYPIYKSHPALFQIVCACDLQKDRREIIAKDFPDCKMFRRFEDMLDEREIDLVDIATCSSDHVKHAIPALKHGFWTLLEPPMSLTVEDALILKGAAVKAKNHLIVMQRGLFAPDFLLAKQMVTDPRLGRLYEITVRREDFVRRDDWQCVKRLGGGASYYAMTDLVLQALKLLPSPPVQMWGDLKRIASLGDAEDYVHVCLKTREFVSADLLFSGGVLPQLRGPSFILHGERGVFSVNPGESTGTLTVIDPSYKFPRRRSSVRTPPLGDLHEAFPVITESISLAPGTFAGPTAFWKYVYESVRTGKAFPITLEDSIEAVKFAHLMKKTSPYK